MIDIKERHSPTLDYWVAPTTNVVPKGITHTANQSIEYNQRDYSNRLSTADLRFKHSLTYGLMTVPRRDNPMLAQLAV